MSNEYTITIFYRMNRKEILQMFLDTQLKKDLSEMFGKNSKISINNISYIRSKDSYLLNVTLFVSSLDDFEILYPTSLNSLIKMAWSVVGSRKEIIIQSSFDLLPE